MASVTEVITNKPTVQHVTLKLTRSEASDLKLFIADWYAKNYAYGHESRLKSNATYTAIDNVLRGKHEGLTVKTVEAVTF